MTTEVIDASMLVEMTSGSGTDQDIVPAAFVREGTDTSREIRPQALAPSHAINLGVQRRSAIAMLVVGLMLVAATSVSLTWWLFSRNSASRNSVSHNSGEDQRDVAAESPGAAPATTASATSTPAPVETAPTTPEAKSPELQLGPPPAPTPSPVEPLVGPPSTPSPDVPGEGTVDAPAVDAPDEEAADEDRTGDDAGKPTVADEDPAVEEPATANPSSGAPEGPKKTTVAVTVSALPSIANGQLELSGMVINIPKGGSATKKLSPGKKKVRWRTDPKAQWTTATAIVVEAGKPISIQLTFTGPRKIAK